jgi:hypothetical protein
VEDVGTDFIVGEQIGFVEGDQEWQVPKNFLGDWIGPFVVHPAVVSAGGLEDDLFGCDDRNSRPC